jgi:hypothetical protein
MSLIEPAWYTRGTIKQSLKNHTDFIQAYTSNLTILTSV